VTGVTISELRFRAPGLRFYAQGLTVCAFGIAAIAWGVAIVVVNPWNWIGVISTLGGVILGVAGVVLCLLVWFIYVWGTVTTWRRWRQLRPPAVVIDASGIRYLAARRPVLVPWPDIEQVGLRRTVFRNRVVAKVFLRLASGAGLVKRDVITVPASRSLNVGLLSDADVPQDLAMRFLAEMAGPRLEITEVDRRNSVGSGRG
jgi:hypothetical protein